VIGFFFYYRKFVPFFIGITALLKKLKIIKFIGALFKGWKCSNFAALIIIPLPLLNLAIEDSTNKSKKTKRIERKRELSLLDLLL
jgi:hypothetical protein